MVIQLKGSKIAELRRARNEHTCAECGLPITLGEQYYCIYWAGAGLGSLKFPKRVHIDCLKDGDQDHD